MAKHGPTSIYDLQVGPRDKRKPEFRVPKESLRRSYWNLHDIAVELEKLGFIKSYKDTSRARNRRVLELTDHGILAVLAFIEGKVIVSKTIEGNTPEEKTARLLKGVLASNADFFTFYNCWDNLAKVVEEETLLKKICLLADEMYYGKYVEVSIAHSSFSFSAYLHGFFGTKHFGRAATFENKIRNKKIMEIIASNEELAKSYISFLAMQDIWDMSSGNLDVENPETLRSERELALLENRVPTEKRLFLDRLTQFFPEYGKANHMFSGNLLFKLIWETEQTKETKAPMFKIKW